MIVGTVLWSYYANTKANDVLVGLAPSPSGGIWAVGSTTASHLIFTEGTGTSISCSPDGDSEFFLVGLNADG